MFFLNGDDSPTFLERLQETAFDVAETWVNRGSQTVTPTVDPNFYPNRGGQSSTPDPYWSPQRQNSNPNLVWGGNPNNNLPQRTQDRPFQVYPERVRMVVEESRFVDRPLSCQEFNARTQEQDKYLQQNPYVYQRMQSLCNNSYEPELNQFLGIRQEWWWAILAVIAVLFIIPKKGD